MAIDISKCQELKIKSTHKISLILQFFLSALCLAAARGRAPFEAGRPPQPARAGFLLKAAVALIAGAPLAPFS